MCVASCRDYKVVCVLGEGNYGKALLVENRKTGQRFTCKQLHEVDDDTSAEIDLLISVSGESPFLCQYFDRFTIPSDDELRAANARAPALPARVCVSCNGQFFFCPVFAARGAVASAARRRASTTS